MRIAELSHPIPDLRPPDSESQSLQSHLLSQIESSIKQCEDVADDPPGSKLAEIASDLRRHLSQLSQLPPFGNTAKLQIWKLSYRLWNACVDLSNAAAAAKSPSGSSSAVERARIRHVAADMLFLAGDVAGVPSPAMKAASFYHRTGLAWHDLRRLDLASSCFEKATDLVSRIGAEKVSDAGERKLLFDLHIARFRTAWEVPDKNLAVTLLNRAKNLLYGSSEHYKSLANQFLAFGNSILSSESEIQGLKEALKLMNEALDLCEKGLAATRTREAKLELMELRSKTLRFISAVHLQNEEYESVIKCVKVLREGCDGGDSHPSLPVLAMKAWLGLGRYGDAEKELRGMVVNKGIPEGVWVSAVEAYFQAAGTAGAETAKGVFLGLLGRCHVSAGSAVRVAHRVIGGSGEGSKVRAKVAAELVSDDRVVALFDGEAAAKERKAMQAVLWNCAADHFHMKDYETSAEMFEKSMLYVPYDIENRVTRAKGFRVLCLCHLGMLQLDRAQEYINEADKLEPSIASSFLKFKIYLQKNDNNGAITQIQAMPSCLDFTPDFLVLSAHEAMACHSLPVAVASLSTLLNFYSLGKPMPLTEVTVLRTLITILTEEAGNEQEALKFMKQARARASELGPDSFFGKGEVGRREQDWFAVTSWNIGTKSGKARNYGLCSEFFRLASEFYSVLVDGLAEEDSGKVCTSLILTVSAMIASEEQNKDTLSDTEVKQAAEMLDKAGKILPSLNADQISTAEPNLPFTYTSTAYDIHGRLNNTTHQTHLIKTFAASKHCTLNHLLQLGLSASRGPRPNPETATFALNECLSTLLSTPSPNYRNVALVVRELIALTSVYKGNTDDEAVLAMYRQAYRVMVGLREGEYPVEEGKWLAMTAWNRAALPVRLGQVEAASRWMEMGLEIARKVSRMETCRGCMEDFVKEFGRKVGMNKGEN